MITTLEFKAKIEELLAQLDPALDVFISVINVESGTGECFGFGCAGCHTEKIVRIAERGFYKHTKHDEAQKAH